MKATEIKLDLHDKIESVAVGQLKDIYGLVINYLNGAEDSDEWGSLPAIQKEKIIKSMEQADAGLGTPATEVIQRVRKQYGLNG